MRLLFWRKDPTELAMSAVRQASEAFAKVHEETLALAKEAHDRAALMQAIVLSNPSTAEMLFAVTDAERMLKTEVLIPTTQGESQS